VADLTLALRDLPQATLDAVLDVLQSSGPGAAVVGVVIYRLTEGSSMGEITVKADEGNLTATVTALDAEGNQTTFDETPTWASNDEGVAQVTPSEDGYSATFTIGEPGVAAITVTGIETGSGEPVEIVSTGLITVTAGDAVVGSVEFAVGAE